MERVKLTAKGVWLIAGISALILPIFLPSLWDGSLFGNAMKLALTSMFLLSLPSSLLALPLASFLNLFFEIYPPSLLGLYMNVLTFFVLGLVQWFWIVPRIFATRPLLQRLDICESNASCVLNEANADASRPWPFPSDPTPLERVLKNE